MELFSHQERGSGYTEPVSASVDFPRVGIVTLNWNNYPDTARLLRSLTTLRYPNYHIYIVDNGSNDGSMDRLEKELGNRSVTLIRNKNNLGFSAGCNRGIAQALNDRCTYVLLINNDCIVMDPEFLNPAIALAEKADIYGVIGGKILCWPDTKRIWSTGGYISRWGTEKYIGYTELDYGQYDAIEERRFISGALMLIKRSVIERIGMLPEQYFFGKEDWEYSSRAIKAGFTLLYCPAFNLCHEASHSHSPTDPTYIYNGTLSKILYKRRNDHPLFFWLWLSMYSIYVTLFFKIRYALLGSSYQQGVEPVTIRRAMMAAIRDCLRVQAITREMLERFRANSKVGERWLNSR
jgi:GT2 family glycosyltransferase